MRPLLLTRSFCLIVLLAPILSKVFLCAQPMNNLLKDVIMPAPNAAALGKYGDIPVNLYTGVPDISVPLYSLQEGDLTLPISMNYHASGIKPGERASWVGLGWSLNVGGIVTRSVLGISDDESGYGYYYGAANNLAITLSDLDLISRGEKDSEPDIFTYNISGYSGKFFFDKNQIPTLVPRNDLKITALFYATKFAGFIIVAPDGTKYYFGDDPDDGLPPKGIEETTVFHPGGTSTYKSSWYPVKITSFDNKYSILFEYEDEAAAYILDVAGCRYSKNYSIFDSGICSSVGVSCFGSEVAGAWTETEVFGKRLKKITTPTTTLDFAPSSSDREDYPGKQLDGLTIRQGVGNSYCMAYEFQYGYWLDIDNNYPPNYPASHKKHLRLNSINQKSCDIANPASGQTWSFEYEAGNVAGLYTKAIDHWGFYNGKVLNNFNQVNAPPTTVINGLNNEATITHGQSDRETDPINVKNGVLNKINYPTGGYTRFEFEANTYPRYQAVDSTVTNLLNLSTPNCSAPYYPCCAGDSPLSPVTLSSPVNEYYFDLSIISAGNCVDPGVVSVSAYSNSGSYLGSYGFNWSYQSNNVLKSIPLSAFGVSFIQSQTYKFQVSAWDGTGNFKLYRKVYSYDWVNVPVGGLRVKKIINNPTQNPALEETVATYQYTESTNPAKSSGVLFRQPAYGFGYFLGAGNGFFSMIMSQSIVPLGDYEGYHIGYQRVIEVRPGNGKTIYEFEYETPNPYPGTYPFPPAQARVKSGKIKKAQTYTEGQVLVKEESSTPTSDIYTPAPPLVFKVFKVPFYQGQTCPSPPPADFAVNQYVPRTGIYRLASKTEMMDGVTTVTSFVYHPNYWELLKESSVTIDGKLHKTKHKYPYDMTASAVRTRLLGENRIGLPIETTKEIDNVIVDGSRTDFSFYDNTTGNQTGSSTASNPVYSWKFHRLEMTWNSGQPTAGLWVLKGSVDKYDIAKGKPSQFTLANWPSETYTWASNGLIQSKTYQNFVWQYDYYPGTRLLRSITDVDGRKTGFTYDNLMRLNKATKDNASVNGSGVVVDGNVKIEYTYHYKDALDPNSWVKTKTTFTPIAGSNLTSAETFEYVDGLGRPLQTVKKAWSPAQKDVVSALTYDHQGRVTKQYTPFETAAGTGALATVPANQPHTLTQYELSPLNRPLSVTPPGWYTTTMGYGSNIASEVSYYDGTNATSYYPAGSLTKTTVTTPQSATKNIETTTYKDKKGRAVLMRKKEAGSSTNIANTYNFYDGKDRLTRVLPPGVGTSAADAGLRFEYAYDAADHLTYKKMPDMAGINMRYNLRNQLVLTQDGNLLALGKWLLAKYDNYGRPLSNGLYTGTNPDPNNATLAYSEQHTSLTYGTSGISLDKVTQSQTWIPGFATPITRNFTYDAVTGRMMTDFGNSHLSNATGTDNYTFHYDYAGNLLTKTRTHKTNPAATALTLTDRYAYDHSGRKTAFYHRIGGIGERQLAQYIYDFRDRLTDKSLGAVTSGGVNSFLQSLDYAYNEQNWLLSINGSSSFSSLSQDAITLCPSNPTTPNPVEAAYTASPDGNDIFKLDLYYESPGLSFGSPIGQRNGNISQLVWQTRGRQRQGYTLQYDYLDRLTTSYYADITSSGTASTDNKFQENIGYFDARGNISTITRNGLYKTTGTATCWTLGSIDNLTYFYNTGTNRLQKVIDIAPTGGTGNPQRNTGFNPGTAGSTVTYAYDVNGNLISDPYKAMTLTYNHLNLPTQMNFGAGKTIDLLYDHTGKKLRKTVRPTATTVSYAQEYVDGLEYRVLGTALLLEAIYHPEGRILSTETGYQYEYSIKDHLGNTRLTFSDLNNNNLVDVPGDILQENHYYPFGMNMNYGWMNNTALLDNKYQFNGMERNEDFGINLDLTIYRAYDPAVGRWWQIDPKPSFSFSSYSSMGNNPLLQMDPLGDTLRGVNAQSAQRTMDIIREAFNNGPQKSTNMADLFQISSDGQTFSNINSGEFLRALEGLSTEQQALAVGYYLAINGSETNVVEVVKRNETISGYGQKALGFVKTGADLDREAAGGHTAQAYYDNKNVKLGSDGSYVAIVMNSKAKILYSDKVYRSPMPGELLSHELIGHGLGGRYGNSGTYGLDESIQSTNMYLRATNKHYYRESHNVTNHSDGWNPNEIPSFLLDKIPPWLRRY